MPNIKHPPAKPEYRHVRKNGGESPGLALTDYVPTLEPALQSQLEKAFDGVIHAVSLISQYRDPYTAIHQRRVAELARAISGEMGLPDRQITGVRVAGLLHDVGKIAIPVEILSKPGKINRYEFSIIKNHCLAGYKILERIDFPWPIGRAILQHHERLDGSGYPYGIAGEDIILEARILGVADVVEAISSHRPYRPALGLERALQEISRASGTVYDSQVVLACLKLLENNEAAFERLMADADAAACATTPVQGCLPDSSGIHG